RKNHIIADTLNGFSATLDKRTSEYSISLFRISVVRRSLDSRKISECKGERCGDFLGGFPKKYYPTHACRKVPNIRHKSYIKINDLVSRFIEFLMYHSMIHICIIADDTYLKKFDSKLMLTVSFISCNIKLHDTVCNNNDKYMCHYMKRTYKTFK